MIDLAPGHKIGLTLQNPVLLAAGSIGCGEALHAGLDLRAFGAIVVGPVTERSRAGTPMPRLAEAQGGIILDTGGQNRGVAATLRAFAGLWERMAAPIIVHLAATDSGALARAAARVTTMQGVSAIEIGFLPGQDVRSLRSNLAALVRTVDVPVLAKVPLHSAIDWAPIVVGEGASAIVIGRSPDAAIAVHAEEATRTQRGLLFGPAVFPIAFRALVETVESDPGAPVIFCGGIHALGQARDALLAGAAAVQLDTLAWIEPEAATSIARAFADE